MFIELVNLVQPLDFSTKICPIFLLSVFLLGRWKSLEFSKGTFNVGQKPHTPAKLFHISRVVQKDRIKFQSTNNVCKPISVSTRKQHITSKISLTINFYLEPKKNLKFSNVSVKILGMIISDFSWYQSVAAEPDLPNLFTKLCSFIPSRSYGSSKGSPKCPPGRL